MDPTTNTQRFNQTKEAIEAIRKGAAGLWQTNEVAAVLDGFNERLAALEQEIAPGNAFITFHPATTATPIR